MALEPDIDSEVGQWGHVDDPISPTRMIPAPFALTSADPLACTDTHVWGQLGQHQAQMPIDISAFRVIEGMLNPLI